MGAGTNRKKKRVFPLPIGPTARQREKSVMKGELSGGKERCLSRKSNEGVSGRGEKKGKMRREDYPPSLRKKKTKKKSAETKKTPRKKKREGEA